MGFLKTIAKTVIYVGVLLVAITFIPGIPPDIKFSEYSIVQPKSLKNNLATNGRLNNAEILFEGKVVGAESFASYNGELYTGAHGGYVLRIAGDKLVPVVKFGKECDGLWEEAKCGRPLGLKFDKKGTLYVCDAYYGIFKVDVKSGKYERIVNSKEPIEGKVPMITNSLDIASNGDIYWTDSSTDFTLQDGVYTMLANPSGRLIKYNADTKKNQVLVRDLAFANGVHLSDNEDFVIVMETLASRIVKYNIKGPKAGKREIFVEGLPGMPDNVHSDNNGGFLVSLVIPIDSENPELSQILIPHPYIRRLATRLLYLLEAPFKCLQTYYPNYYADRIVHFIGSFQAMEFMFKKIVTVLRIDQNGQIVSAAYNTDEKISGISSAFVHNRNLWLGSPWLNYIARVPLNQAFPDLKEKIKTQNTEQVKKPKEKSSPTTTKQPEPTTTTQKPVSETKPSKKSDSKASAEKSKPSHNNVKRSTKN